MSPIRIPRLSLGPRLRELPDFDPPPGGWSALARKLDGAPRRRPYRQASYALAASVFVAVMLALLPKEQLPQAEATPPAQAELAQLMAQSRQLETTLSQLKTQAVVWNGSLAATAGSLEQNLAVVDLQLNYAGPAGARQLWKNRVALMSRLVQTHREATLSPAAYTVSQEFAL